MTAKVLIDAKGKIVNVIEVGAGYTPPEGHTLDKLPDAGVVRKPDGSFDVIPPKAVRPELPKSPTQLEIEAIKLRLDALESKAVT
jgi:hypothetical protein